VFPVNKEVEFVRRVSGTDIALEQVYAPPKLLRTLALARYPQLTDFEKHAAFCILSDIIRDIVGFRRLPVPGVFTRTTAMDSALLRAVVGYTQRYTTAVACVRPEPTETLLGPKRHQTASANGTLFQCETVGDAARRALTWSPKHNGT